MVELYIQIIEVVTHAVVLIVAGKIKLLVQPYGRVQHDVRVGTAGRDVE